jgi:2-polyprenyl-3-methyl-5-hydroxy-6-metoxy-1,4-benzoquinol methylase
MSDFKIPGGEMDVLPPTGFDDSYMGTPPWDIGRPQPVLLALADSGVIKGAVLDSGCGTGEHSLALAARGYTVLGIDAAPRAIAKAQDKARERASSAQFRVADALHLEGLRQRFDTILDSGLFHCFSDEHRAQYVRSLEQVIQPGGTLFLMCFSEAETRPGPRRVTQAELHAAFDENWSIGSIRAERFESLIHDGGAAAWLATIRYRSK